MGALYRFLFKSHWHSRRRVVLVGLLVLLTWSTWFLFAQRQGAENRVLEQTQQDNAKLISGHSMNETPSPQATAAAGLTTFFKQKTWTARAERDGAAAAFNHDLVIPYGATLLPSTDRFGPVSFTQTLRNRAAVGKRLVAQHQPVVSLRYGTQDWAFLISFLPLLTSIVGVLIFTVLLDVEEVSDTLSPRRRFLACLPGQRGALMGAQVLVFMTDAVLTLALILVGGGLFAWVRGGHAAAAYPILTRLSGQLAIWPAWRVVLAVAAVFLLGVLLVYLFGRFVLTYIIRLRRDWSRLLLAVAAYLLVVGEAAVSLLPNLTGLLISWLPLNYLQASRLFYGTDYLPLQVLYMEALDTTRYGRASLILPIRNLSYYAGATMSNLFPPAQAGQVSLWAALLSLGGTSVLILAWLIWRATKRNELL